jgi:hypothetical protein
MSLSKSTDASVPHITFVFGGKHRCDPQRQPPTRRVVFTFVVLASTYVVFAVLAMFSGFYLVAQSSCGKMLNDSVTSWQNPALLAAVQNLVSTPPLRAALTGVDGYAAEVSATCTRSHFWTDFTWMNKAVRSDDDPRCVDASLRRIFNVYLHSHPAPPLAMNGRGASRSLEWATAPCLALRAASAPRFPHVRAGLI